MSPASWLLVACLGGCGAVARYVVDALVARRAHAHFPLGTLVVNVVGSFVLGVIVGSSARSATQLYAGSGFVGAFTTFSTWMLETERLVDDQRLDLAAGNVAAEAIAGLVAATTGFLLGAVVG